MDNMMGLKGRVVWTLRGPDGTIKDRRVDTNLVTDVGDIYLAQLAYGSQWATHAMKLGSTDTAGAKNGAGSFVPVGSYVSGSAHACDNSSPKVGASANILYFEHTWAAGEATGTINVASIVSNVVDLGEDDAGATLAIDQLPDKPITKGAADTLEVDWSITFLGA